MAEEKQKPEGRQFERLRKPLTVKYSRDKKIWEESLIRDISTGGIQLITSENILCQDEVYLHIRLPSCPFEWRQIHGKVVGQRPLLSLSGRPVAGMKITHIAFSGLSEENKKMIEEFIKWFLDYKRKEKKP